MSWDLGRDVPDSEKLYARKLWADFAYPKSPVEQPMEKTPVKRELRAIGRFLNRSM